MLSQGHLNAAELAHHETGGTEQREDVPKAYATYSGNRCSRGPWLRRAAPPASPAPAPSPSAAGLSGLLDRRRTCGEDKGERMPRLLGLGRSGIQSNSPGVSVCLYRRRRDARARLPCLPTWRRRGGAPPCACNATTEYASQRPRRTDGRWWMMACRASFARRESRRNRPPAGSASGPGSSQAVDFGHLTAGWTCLTGAPRAGSQPN